MIHLFLLFVTMAVFAESYGGVALKATGRGAGKLVSFRSSQEFPQFKLTSDFKGDKD